jgi:hypothetical protein
MSHISAIGAAVFSDMSIATPLTPLSSAAIAALDTAAEFQALFATEIDTQGGTKGTNTFVRVKNVRDFPQIGTAPNIINVPVYGQKTTQQIQGQSDAPNMEITVNFVAADWSKEAGCILGNMVGDGKTYVFRFTLMNTEPTGSGDTKYASTAGGLGTVPNSQYYWVGKVDSLLVTPQLSEATTATIAMTLASSLFGAFTV